MEKRFVIAALMLATLACTGASDSGKLSETSHRLVSLDGAPQASPTPPACPNFEVFWNVHSTQPFDLTQINVAQNRTSMIYEGAVPHLPVAMNGYIRAGGIPQGIDMAAYRRDLQIAFDWQIPDPAYSGYIIYDYESFPMTWNNLDPRWFSEYRNLSLQRVRIEHPEFNQEQLEAEAARQYDEGVKAIFLESIHYAKTLRPQAKVGFYGTPNTSRYHLYDGPDGGVLRATNDTFGWLWNEIDAFFPVLYDDFPSGFQYPSGWVVSPQEKLRFIVSMVQEAQRLSSNHGNKPVLPFTWMRYFETNALLLENDLHLMFQTPLLLGVHGVVVWGNETTPFMIRDTQNYVETTLRSVLAEITTSACQERL